MGASDWVDFQEVMLVVVEPLARPLLAILLGAGILTALADMFITLANRLTKTGTKTL